jgi:surface carbohydrate biosynthesis protein
VKVALVVDNPIRDLPGLVLVARHLAERGATALLVPMNLQQWELFALAPNYVLLNYFRKNNEGLIKRLLNVGMGIGVLDTEGGVMSSFSAYEQTLAVDPEVRAGIATFMSWGPRLAEHALDANWFSPSQVVVTGAPRFDFYHEKWRPAALNSGDVPAALPRPVVLLNGNFPLANPQFSTREDEGRRLVHQFGFPAPDVARWLEAQAQGMTGLTQLANLLAERFPAVTFVYRPHPFENIARYDGLLARRPNLHLIRKGSVDSWILNSVAVIQRSCSTAIEAGVAGRFALSPSWLPTARELPAANTVSVHCATSGELVAALSEILSGSFTRPESVETAIEKVVCDWFHAIDGRSAERVTEQILLHAPTRTATAAELSRSLYGMDGRLVQRLAGSVRKTLGLSPDRSFRITRRSSPSWDGSEKYFDVARVSQLSRAIDSARPGKPINVSSAQPAGAAGRHYRVRSVTVSAPGSRGG